jgi:hypothetical protein
MADKRASRIARVSGWTSPLSDYCMAQASGRKVVDGHCLTTTDRQLAAEFRLIHPADTR